MILVLLHMIFLMLEKYISYVVSPQNRMYQDRLIEIICSEVYSTYDFLGLHMILSVLAQICSPCDERNDKRQDTVQKLLCLRNNNVILQDELSIDIKQTLRI